MRSNMIIKAGEEVSGWMSGRTTPWGEGEEGERDNQRGGRTDKASPPWTSPSWLRMSVTINIRGKWL